MSMRLTTLAQIHRESIRELWQYRYVPGFRMDIKMHIWFAKSCDRILRELNECA